MRTFTIGPNEAGQRFDKYLHKLLPEAGNSFLYKMLRKKNITLNNGKAEGRELLNPGDTVKLFLAEETFLKFAGGDKASASASALSNAATAPSGESFISEYQEAYQTLNSRKNKPVVLWEDADILIADKPAGTLTQKAAPGDLSMNEWLIGYLLATGAITATQLITFHPSVCNRLDRNTSGLVLCGKSLAGSQLLSELIRERSIGKFYRTIVRGTIKKSQHMEGFLYKDEHSNQVTIYRDKAQAKPEQQKGLSAIRTSYTPLQTFKVKGQAFTYLEIQLHTGKAHQIRAHLASIGHPILGDTKYGNSACNQMAQRIWHLPYQLLHAYRVAFPAMKGTGEPLSKKSVTAPLPPFFSQILDAGE